MGNVAHRQNNEEEVGEEHQSSVKACDITNTDGLADPRSPNKNRTPILVNKGSEDSQRRPRRAYATKKEDFEKENWQMQKMYLISIHYREWGMPTISNWMHSILISVHNNNLSLEGFVPRLVVDSLSAVLLGSSGVCSCSVSYCTCKGEGEEAILPTKLAL